MNIYRAITFGARPSCHFGINKFANSKILDIFQIFNHAHVVSGAVSFIQMLQVGTGEIIALIAEFSVAVFEISAGFNLTLYAGNRFVAVNPAAGAMILLTQIRHADAAVHAAGGDKGYFIFCFQGNHPLFSCSGRIAIRPYIPSQSSIIENFINALIDQVITS